MGEVPSLQVWLLVGALDIQSFVNLVNIHGVILLNAKGCAGPWDLRVNKWKLFLTVWNPYFIGGLCDHNPRNLYSRHHRWNPRRKMLGCSVVRITLAPSVGSTGRHLSSNPREQEEEERTVMGRGHSKWKDPSGRTNLGMENHVTQW